MGLNEASPLGRVWQAPAVSCTWGVHQRTRWGPTHGRVGGYAPELAAGLAGTARRAGSYVVIVNPHPSEIDDEARAVLQGTAATLLPRLLDRL